VADDATIFLTAMEIAILDDRVIGSLVCPAHAQRLSVFKLLKRLSLARPNDAIDFADIFALAKSTRSALRMQTLLFFLFAKARWDLTCRESCIRAFFLRDII
jgi:hypothetical protein